jgi:aldehyde dehydrogenase (NAD+)
MPTIKDILETMDYGPAPEANTHILQWLEQHKTGFGHFIGGAFVASSGTGTFDVSNPSNDMVIARVAQGTSADIDAAVKAARKAFSSWSKLSGHARAKHLYAIARLIQKRERFLSVLETMDNGKPIRESRDTDIPLVARHFYHHAGWAELMASEFKGYGPLGVCGQIIPWNFPLLMLAWKIAPALAAGNTVVLKPAEFTPLTALAFAEICREAGLPDGIVNIVCGDGETGGHLVAHEGVDKIAFTGSTDVGRIIRQATAGTGKKLSLELGGKSPFIVYEDADLDAAIEGVVDAIWFNQGQVCCAGSRLLIQEGIAPRFIAKLKRRMETLRVGDPLDKSIDIGAIVAPVQLQRIRKLVAKGVEEGGTLLQASCALPTKGNFFAPSLFVDVEPASTVVREEIFGPVAVAMTFRTPEEAVQLANHTAMDSPPPFGRKTSIWRLILPRA